MKALRDLFAPVQYVPGVGPRRARTLAVCDPPIRVVEDLFLFPPRDYFSLQPRSAAEVLRLATRKPPPLVVFEGTIQSRAPTQIRKRPALALILVDPRETGAVELVIPLPRETSRQRAIRDRYPKGMHLRVLGRFYLPPRGRYPRAITFHLLPDNLTFPSSHAGVYRQCKSLRTLDMLRILSRALERYGHALEDFLPPWVREHRRLLPRRTAVERLHFPPGSHRDPEAWRRFVYEELFLYFLSLFQESRPLHESAAPLIRPTGTLTRPFLERLPFSLTSAQERVWREITEDLARGHPMHRLLQGDVGSGKTVVSLLAALSVVENGYQVAVMAPTEILAEQTHMVYTDFLQDLPVRVALLEGSLSPAQKARIKAAVEAGEVDIVIGTHALIQDDVTFSRLGLAIVDEQHRFGVLQRARLLAKGPPGQVPHFLVMTATPIPRTLALTLYGDLDVSILDEKPHRGRVHTSWIRSPERRKALYQRLFQRVLEEDVQAYVVAPLIETSDKLDVQAAQALFEELSTMAPEEVRIGLVHGRMPPRERRAVMQAFREGSFHILVATTVIEVGVDVPRATIMVIEDAHRFGLSQLHQLRGRIQRSDREAHCIVITPSRLSAETRKRIRVFVEHSDGFRIAEADLQLRGPGELYGTRQHGIPRFTFVDLSEGPRIARMIQEAREDARTLLHRDPSLQAPQHRALAFYLKVRAQHRNLITVA